jgi:futalosine hydrolase
MFLITDICSMHIVLAAATRLEIQATIDFLGVNAFQIGPHETDVLVTGVGSIAATYSLARQVAARRPSLVIQAGIAGCFASGAGPAPGEVVVVREEALGDLGVWEGQGFRTLFDLKLTGKNDPPFSDGFLRNPYEKLLAFSGLGQVRGITVNEITTGQDRIGWYQQNLQPVVESMEGGALHYVCLQEKIAFLQIRSVSNAVGERDKAKWDIGAAVKNLNDTLISLLNGLAARDESLLSAGKGNPG